MKTKIRQLLFFLPVLLMVLSLSFALLPRTAYAAPIPTPDGGGTTSTSGSGFDTNLDQHVDRSTIFYDGDFYFDSKIDEDYTYLNQDDGDACPDEIDNLHDDNQHATLHIKTKNKSNGGCEETAKKDNISLAFPNRALMPFHLLDDETIITSDRQNTYTKSGDVYYEDGGDNCKDTIRITTGPGTGGATISLTANTGGDSTSYDNWAQEMDFKKDGGHDSGNGCYSYSPQSYKASTVYLYNTELAGNSPASSTATLNTDSGAGSPDINCGGLSLNWILCPLEEGLSTAVNAIDSIINNLLEIDTDAIFKDCASTQSSSNCKTSTAYHAAWASMRNIALGLLVVAALVMVISQALGYDFIDAYTIKKVLPRLIVAALGITLSWILLKFFVDFTNDIGNGIRNLIYTPFSSLSHSIVLGWSGALGGTILAFAGAIFLGWAQLSFIATALLAVLIAVLVLVIRQVLIVFLILVAPIAIVMYILPNTKNIYDIWWDFFAKALMMFPFIAAFIATGRVFAQVATTQAQSSSSGTVSTAVFNILAFVAYFAPYLLLPLTFRFAGGALRNIGGFINDRSRGGFDRLKRYRANTASTRFKRAQSQSLWDNNSRIGRQANKLASWSTDPLSNAAYVGRNRRVFGRQIPGITKRGLGVASAIDQQRVEQSSKLFEELNKMGYNDKAYRVLTGQWSDAQRAAFTAAGIKEGAPRSIDDLQKIARVMQTDSSLSDTDRIGGAAIEGSMGRLANLYRDPDMTKASTQAAGILGLAAHGFASGQDLAGVGNELSGGGKDWGFAQSVVSQAQVLGGRSRPDTKAGYGVVIKRDADGNLSEFVSGVSAEGGRAEALLDTLSAHDLAGAKGGAVEALKDTIYDRIVTNPSRATQGNLPPEERAKIMRQAESQKDQLFQWASPYSAASNDVKVRALEMIDELGLRNEFDTKFNPANLTDEQRQRLMEERMARGEDPNQNPPGSPPR
jgi:hypothetical protein